MASEGAWAQGGEGAAAEALFNEARTLMQQGDYEQACPKLAESQRLDPAAGTAINLAECYERQGKSATAWAAWLAAASVARRAGQMDRVELAEGKAAALEGTLSRLVIKVPEKVRVPGLKITRGVVAVGESSWDSALPVDPGRYTIRAEAPNRRPFEVAVTVEGSGAVAHVVIPKLQEEGQSFDEPAPVAPAPMTQPPAPAEPMAPPSETFPEVDDERSDFRMYGMVLGGVGVVALGAGTFFALRASSKNSDSEKGCDSNNFCDPRSLKLRDDAVSAGNTATVLTAVGVLAAAGGVVLWVMAPDPASPAVGVAPTPYGRGAALTFQGGF